MLARSFRNLKSLSLLKKFNPAEQIFKYSVPLAPSYTFSYKFSTSQGSSSKNLSDIPDNVKDLISKHGENHPAVVNAYQDLMSASASQNKFSEAIKFGEKALVLMNQLEKTVTINQISLLNNLACIYKLNGQIQECLDHFKKALSLDISNSSSEIKEQLLIIRNSLSSVLQELGLYSDAFKEAKICHEEALKIYGKDHPVLVGIKYSLAKSLLHLGMQKDSLKYLEEALLLCDSTGQGTSLIMANIEITISEILLRLGRGSEAEEHIKSAERVCKKLNDQGELAIKVSSSLGHLYSLSNPQAAFDQFEKAANLAEKFYGRQHVSLAMIFFNLAESQKALGKYDDAIVSHKKSFEIVKKFYGEDHHKAYNYYASIGLIFQEMGDPWKGVENMEKARQINVKHHGENNIAVAIVDMDLGLCHFDCKEYDKALICFNRMLPIFEKYYPANHHNILNGLRHIGTTYNRLGKTEKALEYLQKSLETTRKHYGNNDPNVPDCLNNMGLIKAKLKNHEAGLADLEEAMQYRKKIFGSESEEVAQSYVNIAGIKIVKEKFDEAHDLYSNAEAIYTKNYGKEHFFIGNILSNRGRMYYKQGNIPAAVDYLERAYQILHKNLGHDHPESQGISKLLEDVRRSAK